VAQPVLFVTGIYIFLRNMLLHTVSQKAALPVSGISASPPKAITHIPPFPKSKIIAPPTKVCSSKYKHSFHLMLTCLSNILSSINSLAHSI